MDEVLNHVGDVCQIGTVVDVFYQQVFYTHAFFYHGRNHQPQQACQDESYRQKRTQNAYDAELEAATVLEELDQRKKKVRDEPCQEERQQDTAQSVEQHDNAHDNDDSHHATDKTVESNLLLLHNGCKINKKRRKMA